jgi:hypothetical protein
MKTAHFNYLELSPGNVLPFLRMNISAVQKVSVIALVDSGASINLLPYSVGQALGFDWESAETGPPISGTVQSESRIVKAKVTIGSLDEVELSFCWIKHDNVRLLLGHNDFFAHFTVCFLTRELKFSLFQET